MSHITSDADADRLEEAVLAYLLAEDAGSPLPPEEVLRAYPEVAHELSSFLGDEACLGEALSPLCDLLGQVSTSTLLPGRAGRRAIVAPAKPLPRDFGRYELLEEIGRGGMGVVYKARHLAAKRVVALKTIRGDYSTDASGLARFRNEIDAIVALEHPHIVRILDVGAHDEQLYYTMPLLAGAAMPARLRAFRENPNAAAEFTSQLAGALHFAHQRGVLHRDIKPSNILLDKEGRPYLADFGLAKRIDREASLTETGAVLGTPAFLAPENTVSRKDFTAAGDIYGLGAVLYTLLAGQPPFESDLPWEVARRIREDDPPPLEKANPAVDRDLAAICYKCLEKSPAKRYATAERLANDLASYLAGEAIEARPIGGWDRARRWLRKRALAVSIAGAFAVVLLGAIAVLATSVVLVSRSRADAERQAASLRRQVYAADMRQAFGYWQSGERQALAATLAKYERRSGDVDLRGFEWDFLRSTVDLSPQERTVYRGHMGTVFHATFSPDGAYVASGGFDGTIHVWEADTGKPRFLFPGDVTGARGHRGDVNWIEFSPDGRHLATAGEDGTARLWELSAPFTCRHLGRSRLPLEAIAFSRSGELIAASGLAGNVWVWSGSNGSSLSSFSAGPPMSGIEFGPDDATLFMGGQHGALAAWDWRRKTPLWSVHHPRSYFCVDFSVHDNLLLALDRGGALDVIDARSGEIVGGRRVDFRGGRGVAVNPKRQQLATCGTDCELNLWSSATLTALARTSAHRDDIWSVAYSPDGKRIATTGSDHTVRIWETSVRPPVESVESKGLDSHVAWSPSGAYLLVNSYSENDVRGGHMRIRSIWGRRENRILARWDSSAEMDHACAWAGDDFVLVADSDGAVWKWEWKKDLRQQITPPLGEHVAHADARKHLTHLRPSDGGRSLTLFCSDGCVEVWDLSQKRKSVDRQLAGDWIHDLYAPPEGTWLVGAGRGGVRFWDAIRSRWLEELPAATSSGRFVCLTLSPDEAVVALGQVTGEIRLRDRATGAILFSLLGHRSSVSDLQFSSDGKTLISAGSDGTVRLWSISARQEMFALEEREADVASIALSPDGELLAIGGTPLANGDCVSLYRLRDGSPTR